MKYTGWRQSDFTVQGCAGQVEHAEVHTVADRQALEADERERRNAEAGGPSIIIV
jgi:hypothetical protein